MNVSPERLLPFCIQEKPDNIAVGPGSSYPVGLTLSQLIDFYWNKQFKVNFQGTVIGIQRDGSWDPENPEVYTIEISVDMELKASSGTTYSYRSWDGHDFLLFQARSPVELNCGNPRGYPEYMNSTSSAMDMDITLPFISSKDTIISEEPMLRVLNLVGSLETQLHPPENYPTDSYVTITASPTVYLYEDKYYPAIALYCRLTLQSWVYPNDFQVSSEKGNSSEIVRKEVDFYDQKIYMYGSPNLEVDDYSLTYDYSGLNIRIQTDGEWKDF